jgi:hypothetical protein
MKSSELIAPKSKKEIKEILGKYFHMSVSARIQNDGTVDIDGGCELAEPMDELPIKFGTISGHFGCGACGLTSLTNAPTKVTSDFQCYQNELTSLVGAPKYVGNNFYCHANPLVSLDGLSEHIGRLFVCTWSPELPLLRALRAKEGVYIGILGGYGRQGEHPITSIINRFIPHENLRHAILDCQKALIEAGFAGNARW